MNKLTIEQTWAKNQAEQIIQEHVHAMMCSTSSYDPKDEDELKDFMLSECAYILSRKLLEGEYTPMEYNAVRNAVTALIYGVFAIQVDDEESVPESDVIAQKVGMTCFGVSTVNRGGVCGMLKNSIEAGINHVEFVSYDGRYPNFCSGELVLIINGMTHYFGNRYYDCQDETHHKAFWSKNWLDMEGEWEIDCIELPEFLRSYAHEIDRTFNANVARRCCGGCR